MRLALTDRFCASAKPQAGKAQSDYFDSVVSGLALRVTPNVKSWSFMSTVASKRVRRTLGHYPSMALTSARTAALEYKGDSRTGATTVAHAIAMFLKAKPRRTLEEVRRRFDKNVLPELGAIRLVELHRADAARVIDAVKKPGGADRGFGLQRTCERSDAGQLPPGFSIATR